MIYNFEALPDRKTSESIKWHYYEEDVLPMWVADMDFVSPEPVIRALQERAAHGVFGYPGEVDGLRQIIVERLSSLYDWQVAPEDLVFIPGVVTGISMAAHAVVGSDSLLIQPPVYMPFLSIHHNTGGARQDAQLVCDSDGNYAIDWDVFESAINDQTRMFLMSNPHNPVGRVFTAEELQRMAEICLRRGLVICSDEIHCDLVFSGHRHIPVASLSPEIAQQTITLMAPSKTFNIAGLSCSFAVIQNPELRERFKKSQMGLVHGVNLFGLVAAKAAYTEGQEWLNQLLAYLEGNRDVMYRFVKEEMPGVNMPCPEGTYLAWLDFRAAGIQKNAGEYFLKNARVGLVDGEAFGSGGEGFARLNFGCPRSMLMEALEKMRLALPGLK